VLRGIVTVTDIQLLSTDILLLSTDILLVFLQISCSLSTDILLVIYKYPVVIYKVRANFPAITWVQHGISFPAVSCSVLHKLGVTSIYIYICVCVCVCEIV
jgi:hypothetical protein